MRTSLNNIFETEQYLTGQLAPEDRLVYDARLIVNTELCDQTHWQQRTYEVVRAYGRMQLRNELEKIHERLMTEPQHNSFRKRILNIFFL
ncbi:MAG: hypothetical protein ACTHJT_07060 [Cytophaga sp.]|uniref:hypothetical protein n=1 Tax=Cytophaga sp. TaxID=29535 RepID=UPI003F7DE54B